MSRSLAELYAERTRLQRQLEERVGYGYGAGAIAYVAAKLTEVEQDILRAHHFVCPHCNKSLEHLADSPVKVPVPSSDYWKWATCACRKCNSLSVRYYTSGDHDDEHYECRSCYHRWSVDGPDA